MICDLAYITQRKIASTEAFRLTYCEEFCTSGMIFSFCMAAWLRNLNQMINLFEIPPLVAQNALLTRRSIPAASVVDEGQASPAAAAGADETAEEDDDCDLEGAVGSDDGERVDPKRCLCGFQDRSLTKKRMVLGTVAETFELATELVI